MAIVVYLLVAIIALLMLVRFGRTPKNKSNGPPSPFKLPILGNLHQLGSLPHRSLQALSSKHGPLMLLHLGKFPTIVVSSADIAQEVLKEKDAVFASRPFSYAAHHLLYGSSDMAFSPYGDYWRRLRKVCVLELLSLKRVQSFNPVRDEEVESMMKEISPICSAAADINLFDVFLNLSGNIITRVALGRTYRGGETSENRFAHLVKEFLELMGSFYVADYFPWLEWVDKLTGMKSRLKRNFRAWDDFLDEVIEENLRMTNDQEGRTNFLSVLLQIPRDGTPDVQLAKDNIKAIIVDMIVGASHSTATALEWAMAELIKNPGAMEKAQEEVRRVVGRKSKVEEDDIIQMIYLQSVIKEALRLHPPAPLLLPHETSASTTLQGHQISPKTRVLINAWAIGRNPESWKNAEEFLPERFVDDPTDYKGQDFRFIPFGAGRRGCPGISFASPTLEHALANLLYSFDWKMPGNKTKDDLDLTEVSEVTVHMKVPLQLVPVRHFS